MVDDMPLTICSTTNGMHEQCLIGLQRNRRKRISRRAGFSLIELLVVVMASLVAMAMAVPVFQNARRGYQLRGAVVDLAGLLQRSRMFCIQNNRLVPVVTAAPGNTQVFLDSFPVGNPNGAYDAGQGELMLQLPPNITQTNPGASILIPPATLGFNNPQAPPARFNGRGLPCVFNGAVCTNYLPNVGEVGFVYYLNQNINGQQRWAAVSITPAGQVKTWSRSNGTWSNI
jgi:prepilin-type N-terminal cleavage/methylation domain-containing protein